MGGFSSYPSGYDPNAYDPNWMGGTPDTPGAGWGSSPMGMAAAGLGPQNATGGYGSPITPPASVSRPPIPTPSPGQYGGPLPGIPFGTPPTPPPGPPGSSPPVLGLSGLNSSNQMADQARMVQGNRINQTMQGGPMATGPIYNGPSMSSMLRRPTVMASNNVAVDPSTWGLAVQPRGPDGPGWQQPGYRPGMSAMQTFPTEPRQVSPYSAPAPRFGVPSSPSVASVSRTSPYGPPSGRSAF